MMKTVTSTLVRNAGNWRYRIGHYPHLLPGRMTTSFPLIPDILLIFYCKMAIKHTIMGHGN